VKDYHGEAVKGFFFWQRRRERGLNNKYKNLKARAKKISLLVRKTLTE